MNQIDQILHQTLVFKNMNKFEIIFKIEFNGKKNFLTNHSRNQIVERMQMHEPIVLHSNYLANWMDLMLQSNWL